MNTGLIDHLTAPGGPFEFTEVEIGGTVCHVFKHAPEYLSQIYGGLNHFSDRELAVFEGRRLSYREALEQATVLSAKLQEEFAVGRGSRVALAMRNAPEWLVAFIAITALGGVAVLINSRGSADEMAYCLETTNCSLLITDTRTGDRIDSMTTITRISFDLERSFTLAGDVEPLAGTAAENGLPMVACDPDETALIMFTSGTTGRPKGACLTHLGILTALKTIEYSSAIIGAQLAAKYGIDLRTLAANRPQPCTLLMFPLFHVSGCYSVFLSNLLQGGKIVMMPRWDVEQAMQHIQSEQVTTFPGVPTMYWDLLNHADRDQFDLRSLASLSVAGQSTPLTLLQSIHEAFPAAVVGCGYGMTETNGPVSMIIGEDLLAAPNSVGRAVATSEIKLRKDDGNWAAQGQRGEVCVRGAIVMKGYDNQDEANRKAFSDGWFATGDIGVFDDQERLQIVDRATEMVISAGENIYCAEVERVIDQAPDVIEVATIGAADERLGEKLIAFIRTREESDQTVESILDAASDQLASYKLPAETFLVDEPLPRNATGKILKIELRERYRLLTENRHS